MIAMRKRALLPLVLLAPALAAPLDAVELEPLTSMELHELCLAYVDAPESPEAHACAAYIRGFIEGSDRVIVRNRDTQPRPESFSERAWRTRLGMQTPEPRYCLDETLSLQELVAQLLIQAKRRTPSDDVSASALLCATLGRFHPCSR